MCSTLLRVKLSLHSLPFNTTEFASEEGRGWPATERSANLSPTFDTRMFCGAHAVVWHGTCPSNS